MKSIKKVAALVLTIVCVLAMSGFSSMASSKESSESASNREYFNTSVYDKSSSSYTITNQENAKEGDVVWFHTVIIMPEHVSPNSEMADWKCYTNINFVYNKDLQIAFYDNKEDAKNNNLSKAKEVWKNEYFTEKYSEDMFNYYISLSFDTEKINENNWPYMVISYSTTYSEAPTEQIERQSQIENLVIFIMVLILLGILIFPCNKFRKEAAFPDDSHSSDK